ncbi:lipoprotein, partial [human gut metagenome]
MQRATVITQRPMKIRPRLLARALSLEPGQPFTVDAQNRTLTELNKLGVFRSVTLNVPPADSLAGSDSLDIEIDARLDLPIAADLETDVVSKSNSFLGPGIAFKVSHNNLFRGGEVLALKLNGSYEWQTGNKQSGGRDSRLNSYELGLNATLDLPRLLWPGAARRHARATHTEGRTSFQLGLDLMNRPDYFRMISFGGSAGYTFRTSAYSHHALTLLKLTYNKLLHTTESFDQTLDANPTIAMSFRDQFIPSLGYTYTFDRLYGQTGNRRLFWQNSLTSAGNLL